MKEKLKKILTNLPYKLPSILGFITMYVIPIILFSNIIPYTRADIPAGLTKAGYFAVALLVLILISKIKQRILQNPKSLKRGLILSIFPVLFWAVIKVGVDYIEKMVVSFSNYWDRIIIFILMGRIFYCIGEILNAKPESEDKKQ